MAEATLNGLKKYSNRKNVFCMRLNLQCRRQLLANFPS
jgi:hypothetical protein